MKAINFIIDTLYDIFEYILMLLIVGIAVLVILWRLEVLLMNSFLLYLKPQVQ